MSTIEAVKPEVVHYTVDGVSSIESLVQALSPLVRQEAAFGVMLTITGIALDRHRDLWPEARRLPGGRAHFGTWCRGVAYVFSDPPCLREARIHLGMAPRIWGTRIHAGHDPDTAVAWLEQY